jgi:2-iminobutanoate/2-iminopropanoate deaminase
MHTDILKFSLLPIIISSTVLLGPLIISNIRITHTYVRLKTNGGGDIMEKNTISTSKAPLPVGPYSQAVRFGNLLFLSGQIPIDPSTNELIRGTVEDECERILMNIKAILEEAESSIDNVLKVTIFLNDMEDFPKVNEVYKNFFSEEPPARTCIQAPKLPLDARIEIDVIAGI